LYGGKCILYIYRAVYYVCRENNNLVFKAKDVEYCKQDALPSELSRPTYLVPVTDVYQSCLLQAAEKEASMAEKKQHARKEKKSQKKTENVAGGRPQSGQFQRNKGNKEQGWKSAQKENSQGRQSIQKERKFPEETDSKVNVLVMFIDDTEFITMKHELSIFNMNYLFSNKLNLFHCHLNIV